MSYHVFTATRGGACAHMGEYPDHGAARAAWTLARPAGAIVTNAEGVALSTTSTTPPALRTALESFARSFFAAPASTPAAPPAATPKALQSGKDRIALATIAKALRIPAGRDPEEIATRALASIKTYRLDAQVHGAEIERLHGVIVELHEENKKLHARVKRGTRGTKPAPRVAETPVEQLLRRINELAAGVGR